MAEPDDFAARYGRWGLVLGASEGVGSAFALEVARRGLDVVLVARRQEVLDEVARGITSETGRDARAVAIDLSLGDAAERVLSATAGLEVGLLAYNAGADSTYRRFLDEPVDTALAMLHRNCTVPTRLCHHYARPMVDRGRGGIIVVSSGAGVAGAPNMVAYGATKAYDSVFTEALWTEVHEHGVDVLSLVLGETDTPALRRLRAQRGFADDPDAPLPGAATVDEVVAEALEHLPLGPSWTVGEQVREGLKLLAGFSRNEVVGFMVEASKGAMG